MYELQLHPGGVQERGRISLPVILKSISATDDAYTPPVKQDRTNPYGSARDAPSRSGAAVSLSITLRSITAGSIAAVEHPRGEQGSTETP